MRGNPVTLAVLVCLLNMLITPLAQAEGEADPLWNRPSFEKKIYGIGQRILAANGITERITFFYDKADIRNASASRYLGPNTIRVYKDLLDVMDSDDELAAVLSHEIAHITKRHHRRSGTKQVVAKVALASVLIAGGTAAAIATGGATTPLMAGMAKGIKKGNRHGMSVTDPLHRPYEKEADLVGLDYMVKAGYNPVSMETVMTKVVADAGPFTTFFSSHPMGTERLTYIHDAIVKKYPQYLDAEMADDPLPGSPYPLNRALAGTTQAHQPAKLASTERPPEHTVTAPRHSASAAVSPVIPKPVATQPIAKKNAPLAVSPVSKETFTSEAFTSVAQALLTLNPDQVKILQAVTRHGYLSRVEVGEQWAHLNPDDRTVFLSELVQKRLLKIVGAEPEELFILTDWAAESLTSHR